MSTSQSSPILAVNTPRLASVRNEPLRSGRSVSVYIALTVGLIILADVLFFQRPIGITLAIFGFSLGSAIAFRSVRFLGHWPGRVVTLAYLGLCLALIEHPGVLRLTIAMLALLTLAILNGRGFSHDPLVWISSWFEWLIRSVAQAPRDLLLGNRWTKLHARNRSRPGRILLNWGIPLGLSLVFIGLFSAANPIIAQWVSAVWRSTSDFISRFGEYLNPARIALWILVGAGVWGLLRVRTRWRRANTVAFESPSTKPYQPSASLLVRCLSLFNVVFAIQLTLDLLTVLSSGGNLPEGMTYSEYARRGAYPLVATALLAAGFVVLTFPTTSSATASWAGAAKWARGLVYVWVGQNIILTATAGWRLWMYVEAFGLTRLRVAAAIWMLLVACGLVLIIWRIVSHRSNAWLCRVNSLALVSVLYACCFINFDRIIAWHGVANSMELGGPGPRVDLKYLRQLGIDAIPTMEWLAMQLDRQHPVSVAAGSHAMELRKHLQGDMRSWHGWTLRRASIAASHPPDEQPKTAR